MTEILSFPEAISDSEKYSKRHLLLGNGFSISCCPDIFHYSSIFSSADFSDNPKITEVFEELGTQDFEKVIRSLESAADVVHLYSDASAPISRAMRADAEYLKETLVQTIANNHPAFPSVIPNEKYLQCQLFLHNFLGPDNSGHIFTLNYDLLLYWTLMHKDDDEFIELSINDGFGNDEDDPGADYVVWQGETGAHNARIHFLHGALQLYDAGKELQKYTWIRTNERLIDQARLAISHKKFPLFVSEGTSPQKKEKIRHNAYLYQGFKQLTANAQTIKHCFFIYGHSLADNDDHILKRLGKGRFSKLYVSLYGDPDNEVNQSIIQKTYQLSELRTEKYPLEITFYDAESAAVWG